MIYVMNNYNSVTGVLCNQSPNGEVYIDDAFTENLDGTQILEFQVPIERKENTYHLSDDLLVENMLIYRTRYGKNVILRILEVEETRQSSGLYKNIRAEGIIVSDFSRAIKEPENYVQDAENPDRGDYQPFTSTYQDEIDKILVDTGWVLGTSDYDLSADYDVHRKDYQNAYQQLIELVEDLGAEVDYNVVLDGQVIREKRIDIKFQLGSASNMLFHYTADLDDVSRTIDSTDTITAIVPLGKQQDNKKRITIEGLSQSYLDNIIAGTPYEGDFFIEDNYIYSKWSYDRYSTDGYQRKGLFESDAENQDGTLKYGIVELEKRHIPVIDYDMKLFTLEQYLVGEEKKPIRLGDNIVCIDELLNPDMRISARIKELVTSNTTPDNESTVLSNIIEIYETPSSLMQELRRELDDNITETSNTSNDLTGLGKNVYDDSFEYQGRYWSNGTQFTDGEGETISAISTDNPNVSFPKEGTKGRYLLEAVGTTGEHQIFFSVNPISIYTYSAYRLRIRIRQLVQETTGDSRTYAGFLCMDEDFNYILHNYFCMYDEDLQTGDGWQVFTGDITGTQDAPYDSGLNKFPSGTKYVRVIIFTNYPYGDGTVQIDYAEIEDVTNVEDDTTDPTFSLRARHWSYDRYGKFPPAIEDDQYVEEGNGKDGSNAFHFNRSNHDSVLYLCWRKAITYDPNKKYTVSTTWEGYGETYAFTFGVLCLDSNYELAGSVQKSPQSGFLHFGYNGFVDSEINFDASDVPSGTVYLRPYCQIAEGDSGYDGYLDSVNLIEISKPADVSDLTEANLLGLQDPKFKDAGKWWATTENSQHLYVETDPVSEYVYPNSFTKDGNNGTYACQWSDSVSGTWEGTIFGRRFIPVETARTYRLTAVAKTNIDSAYHGNIYCSIGVYCYDSDYTYLGAKYPVKYGERDFFDYNYTTNYWREWSKMICDHTTSSSYQSGFITNTAFVRPFAIFDFSGGATTGSVWLDSLTFEDVQTNFETNTYYDPHFNYGNDYWTLSTASGNKNPIPCTKYRASGDSERIHMPDFSLNLQSAIRTKYGRQDFWSRKLIPIDINQTYRGRFRVIVDINDTLSGSQRMYAGLRCYDANYNSIGANNVYFIVAGTVQYAPNWTLYEGTISGIEYNLSAQTQTKFYSGTKYIRLMCLVAYNYGGTGYNNDAWCRVDQLDFDKIT